MGGIKAELAVSRRIKSGELPDNTALVLLTASIHTFLTNIIIGATARRFLAEKFAVDGQVRLQKRSNV
jgi:hypothetical protein